MSHPPDGPPGIVVGSSVKVESGSESGSESGG